MGHRRRGEPGAKVSKRSRRHGAAWSESTVFTWDDRAARLWGCWSYPVGQRASSFSTGPPEGRSRRATVAKVGAADAGSRPATLTHGMSRKVRGTAAIRWRTSDVAREALTVTALLPDRYTASPRYAQKTKSTQKIGTGQIERHLKPLLGKRHVARLEAGRHPSRFRGNP